MAWARSSFRVKVRRSQQARGRRRTDPRSLRRRRTPARPAARRPPRGRPSVRRPRRAHGPLAGPPPLADPPSSPTGRGAATRWDPRPGVQPHQVGGGGPDGSLRVALGRSSIGGGARLRCPLPASAAPPSPSERGAHLRLLVLLWQRRQRQPEDRPRSSSSSALMGHPSPVHACAESTRDPIRRWVELCRRSPLVTSAAQPGVDDRARVPSHAMAAEREDALVRGSAHRHRGLPVAGVGVDGDRPRRIRDELEGGRPWLAVAAGRRRARRHGGHRRSSFARIRTGCSPPALIVAELAVGFALGRRRRLGLRR